MSDELELLKFLINNGIAVACLFFTLKRIVPTIDNLSAAINKLSSDIDKRLNNVEHEVREMRHEISFIKKGA